MQNVLNRQTTSLKDVGVKMPKICPGFWALHVEKLRTRILNMAKIN